MKNPNVASPLYRLLFPTMIAAALVLAASQPAHAWTRPELGFAVGTTLGADGTVNSGGAAAAFSPMWPVADRARFGFTIFADDIGSHLGHMLDPNNGVDLGLTAFSHRWTWGGAWRGDVDVVHAGRWTAAATGTWGFWRVEDDVRGTVFSAASAVGVGLGGEIRRPCGPSQTLGLAVRWQRLFAERNASYRRVEHYATAALEWSWAAPAQP